MKRRILTVVLIALAVASMGARRRSVGGVRACAALKSGNVVLRFAGSLSGCATGNGVSCQPGETISVDLTSFGYDARCGSHQTTMRFGDARTVSMTTTGAFPSFVHQYETAGGYSLEATVSNGHSTASVSQMVMVESAGY